MDVERPIQMEGKIGLIEIVHMQPSFNPLTGGFPGFEPNPDYVKLRFLIGDIESHRSEVVLKKEDVKKLNMMLGDDVTIHVSSKAFPTSDAPAAYSKAIIASVQMNRHAERQHQKNVISDTKPVNPPSWSWNPQTGARINVMPPIEHEEKPIDRKYLEYVDLNLTYPDANGYGGLSVKKADLLGMKATAGDTIFIMVTKP